jgi:hypothetical protein
MALSNQQIERYARQIIVPGVGGIGQERLLSARLMLAGRTADVASTLLYMVGAGVGEIHLRTPASDESERDSLIMRASALNPDVVVRAGAENVTGLTLVLALNGDLETSELILSPGLQSAHVPLVLVRLDEPAVIAILPRRPPCAVCADVDLLAPVTRRGDNAGFVAMIAAAEAFKLLACLAPLPSPTLLQFDGFACARRELIQRPHEAGCPCSINT